jgi:hypothetical protein
MQNLEKREQKETFFHSKDKGLSGSLIRKIRMGSTPNLLFRGFHFVEPIIIWQKLLLDMPSDGSLLTDTYFRAISERYSSS